MVVTVKVGRRIHRNKDGSFINKSITSARNLMSIQQYMWKTIEYGFGVASKKAAVQTKRGKNIGFTHSKKKYTEEEDLNYNIEWLVITITGNEDIEEDQYQKALKFFDKLENQPILQKYVSNRKEEDIDKDISKVYSPKNKRIKKSIKVTLEKAGDQSITKVLNEVGILVFVTKEENIKEVLDEINSENTEELQQTKDL